MFERLFLKRDVFGYFGLKLEFDSENKSSLY
jgi:hypothetical protein